MTALVPLHFDTLDVRLADQDGEPWFVLADVCRALGIKNPSQVASRLDADEKGVIINDTLGGRQEMVIISEPGLNWVVMRSNAANTPGTFAHRFRRWLTHEVLPSLRKHGCYPPPAALPLLPVDDERPWDGQEKTIGERFREERERWESENGYKMAGTIPLMSKPVVRAIEDNLGGIRKGDRIFYLLSAGIDVIYVLFGQRTLTTGERALRDAYRAADPQQRQAIMARAETLRLTADA